MRGGPSTGSAERSVVELGASSLLFLCITGDRAQTVRLTFFSHSPSIPDSDTRSVVPFDGLLPVRRRLTGFSLITDLTTSHFSM